MATVRIQPLRPFTTYVCAGVVALLVALALIVGGAAASDPYSDSSTSSVLILVGTALGLVGVVLLLVGLARLLDGVYAHLAMRRVERGVDVS